MATYTIRKGKHRAWPWRFGLYLSKNKIRFRVIFDISCKYQIPGEDQQDINKLFGIGYFPDHHKESARFGWRYNEGINKIELFAYCYVSGQRITEFITSVPFHQSHVLQLNITSNFYHLIVVKDSFEVSKSIQHKNKRNWSFPLGVFFGGNQPAPHTIKIEMKKA